MGASEPVRSSQRRLTAERRIRPCIARAAGHQNAIFGGRTRRTSRALSLTQRHPAHSIRRASSVQEHLCKHKMDAIRAWTRSQQASGKRIALADKARRGMHKVSTRGSRGRRVATGRPTRPAHLRGAGHARNSSEVDVGHLGEGLVEERSLADGFQRCTVGGSAAGPSLLSDMLSIRFSQTVSGPIYG